MFTPNNKEKLAAKPGFVPPVDNWSLPPYLPETECSSLGYSSISSSLYLVEEEKVKREFDGIKPEGGFDHPCSHVNAVLRDDEDLERAHLRWTRYWFEESGIVVETKKSAISTKKA